MSEVVNQGLTIGNPNDPARIAGRLGRLKEAIVRAEGDRKVELQAEIDRLEQQREAIKVALGL